MDSRVRYQVSLELVQIDIQRTVESQGSCDRRDYLTDDSIQIAVRRTIDIQVSATDVVDGLIVNHEGTVGVF